MLTYSPKVGDAPWQCMKVGPAGELDDNAPSWKRAEYEVHFRDPDVVIKNFLDNPDFDGEVDYVPYIERDSQGRRRRSDFFSGDYAWEHSV